MANYGAKSPIFAPFQGVEPAAADPTYGAGIIIGKLVSCVVTPNNAEGDLPADNSTAEYLSEITDEDIALETDDLILQNSLILYGAHMRGNDIVFKRGDVAPYGGYAFYHTAMRAGQQVHIGHFFPKVRAARGAKTYNTRGKTIEFGITSISMKAMFTNTDNIEIESEPFTNESDAYAWCAGKLGIATYYTIDVQAQNKSASKYVDCEGKCFVPAGNTFELLITGYDSVSAAYDNGVDKKSAITGGTGTYTLANVAENHDIVVIFGA